MTKEQSKAARAVMEAWENGEEIEWRHADGGSLWYIVCSETVVWDFEGYEYRIKPKEKLIYLNIYLDDRIGLGVSAHWDKDDAIRMSGVPEFTKQLAIATPITVVI